MAKPFLIGDNNPYGADPEFALWPSPEGSAGWRLCVVILGMGRTAYCDAFERRNLLEQSKWSAPAARIAAAAMREEMKGAPAILLGAKVCKAFGYDFVPFMRCEREPFVLLPHPSGLCRLWNDPASIRRARVVVAELVS